VYIDLNTRDYGGFVDQAPKALRQKLGLPAGYNYTWSGEYEFELRAKERLKIILPIVFFVIFMLLYMVFHSVKMQSSLIEVNPVAISHCPMGKPIRTVGVTSFEEMLDGQWVAVEPYLHTKKDFEAA
jgi:Cu/Ag efflux pump CusA